MASPKNRNKAHSSLAGKWQATTFAEKINSLTLMAGGAIVLVTAIDTVSLFKTYNACKNRVEWIGPDQYSNYALVVLAALAVSLVACWWLRRTKGWLFLPVFLLSLPIMSYLGFQHFFVLCAF